MIILNFLMYIIYDDILNGFQKLSFELVMVGVNVLWKFTSYLMIFITNNSYKVFLSRL